MVQDGDRGVARRIAARTTIRDVRIASSAFNLALIPTGGALSYSLDESIQVGWHEGASLFTLNCEYGVDVSEEVVVELEDQDAPEDSEREIATVKFTLSGLFEIKLRESDSPATSEEVTAYCSTTGAFALYPYAREYISDVTGRLGLPSLTIPVKLMPVTQNEPVD